MGPGEGLQASERLRYSREALEEGNYQYVVRQSQEAVELLLKVALRLVGVEPPKWRDVGPVLRREVDRFPSSSETLFQGRQGYRGSSEEGAGYIR